MEGLVANLLILEDGTLAKFLQRREHPDLPYQFRWIVKIKIEYGLGESEIVTGYGETEEQAIQVARSPYNMSRKNPRKVKFL